MADEPQQVNLFDSPEVALTVGDGPLVAPARVGFLAGMFSTWFRDGKTDAADQAQFLEIARSALERAASV